MRPVFRALLGVVLLLSLILAAPSVSQATTTLHELHVIVGSAEIAYAEVGSPDAPVLVMLNGTASPMSDWDPKFIGRLARDGHRVVVFDYPGLGGSSNIAQGTTFDDLADLVAQFIRVRGYGDTDVLGWSMGGFIAQRLLVRHPDVLRRVVLAATNPGGDRAVLGPKWVQRIDSNADSALSAYVRTNYPSGKHHRGWAFINRVNRAIDAGRYPTYRVPSRTDRIMVAAEDPWLRSNENLVELRSVQNPVLVIDGREDVVTPLRNSRVIRNALPNSTLNVVPHAGHSFLFQRPVVIADVVSTFLS